MEREVSMSEALTGSEPDPADETDYVEEEDELERRQLREEAAGIDWRNEEYR